MNYLHWNEQTITDFSEKSISEMYDRGYVFTRIGKGVMHQTRSVRIDISKFELSSENRRIIKKISPADLSETTTPLTKYDFSIGKLGKDFYDKKFGPGIMSAQKIKEMLTDVSRSNFNTLLIYTIYPSTIPSGFAICYQNADILHYSYPFYDLEKSPKDMGLGMMTLAIEHARKAGMKYVYLGSLQRPTDTYKLQFKGLEWFDGQKWSTDLDAVREILKIAE